MRLGVSRPGRITRAGRDFLIIYLLEFFVKQRYYLALGLLQIFVIFRMAGKDYVLTIIKNFTRGRVRVYCLIDCWFLREDVIQIVIEISKFRHKKKIQILS